MIWMFIFLLRISVQHAQAQLPGIVRQAFHFEKQRQLVGQQPDLGFKQVVSGQAEMKSTLYCCASEPPSFDSTSIFTRSSGWPVPDLTLESEHSFSKMGDS